MDVTYRENFHTSDMKANALSNPAIQSDTTVNLYRGGGTRLSLVISVLKCFETRLNYYNYSGEGRDAYETFICHFVSTYGYVFINNSTARFNSPQTEQVYYSLITFLHIRFWDKSLIFDTSRSHFLMNTTHYYIQRLKTRKENAARVSNLHEWILSSDLVERTQRHTKSRSGPPI